MPSVGNDTVAQDFSTDVGGQTRLGPSDYTALRLQTGGALHMGPFRWGPATQPIAVRISHSCAIDAPALNSECQGAGRSGRIKLSGYPLAGACQLRTNAIYYVHLQLVGH